MKLLLGKHFADAIVRSTEKTVRHRIRVRNSRATSKTSGMIRGVGSLVDFRGQVGVRLVRAKSDRDSIRGDAKKVASDISSAVVKTASRLS